MATMIQIEKFALIILYLFVNKPKAFTIKFNDAYDKYKHVKSNDFLVNCSRILG